MPLVLEGQTDRVFVHFIMPLGIRSPEDLGYLQEPTSADAENRLMHKEARAKRRCMF